MDQPGTDVVALSRADHAIYQDLSHRLAQNEYIDVDEIQVCVAHGEVWLAGFCEQWELKRMATAIAEAVPGVRAVHNHIQVLSENSAFGSSDFA